MFLLMLPAEFLKSPRMKKMIIMDICVGERLRVDETSLVEVVRVKTGVVKLGFEAPKNVLILRSELIKPPRHKSVFSMRPRSK